MLVSDLKTNLTGMSHGGTLNKVRNLEYLLERVANVVNGRLDAIETEREQQLSQIIHDDLQSYPLPSDYKKLIDLAPQDDRQALDRASRSPIETFSAKLNLRNKDISFESKEGVKFIRINWKSTSAKTLHTMNSLTDDGTIIVVGSATGLKANSLYKLSGNASIEFDLVATGDGISVLNKTNVVDLSTWDELADFIVPVYLGAVDKFTSITLTWGNDITANLWTSVAQTTQADGTAVRVGWNFFLFPWTTATKTGTVAPATTDSFKLTIAATGAISNIRVDNILVSLGRFFDLKYYSQFAFRNSAGTWISRPTTDTDSIVYTGTALQIYQLECLMAIAQQLEGTDSSFDIGWAKSDLYRESPDKPGLYQIYRAEHPSEAKKFVDNYWNLPRFKR